MEVKEGFWYFWHMFIRIKKIPKKNYYRVQIVENYRQRGRVKQKIVRHIGIAHNQEELEEYKKLAQIIMQIIDNQREPKLFSPAQLEKLKIKDNSALPVNLKNLREVERLIIGIDDIYGSLYDQVGYSKIFTGKPVSGQIIKHLVLGRIAYPRSKRSTQEFLSRDFGIEIKLEQIYRALDAIDDQAIEKIQQRSFQYTENLFSKDITIVFYDCTTLYFESFTEDELKSFGYSKDNKFNQSQVLLALAVSESGLPLGYELFSGNFYEGHTLKLVIEKLKKRLKAHRSIIVADSGLLNKENLHYLEKEGIEFIVGARLKSLKKTYQEQILDSKPMLKKQPDGDVLRILEIPYSDSIRLIVSHSEKRAEKDRKDREKAIERLKKRLSQSKNIKNLLNNYGYKKYIKIQGDSKIEIDEEKLFSDSQWDGLHGIYTNIKDIEAEVLLSQYHGLWQVEESFRIEKHDLLIRPIYHWKPRRIKSHIAIVYMAFSLVRFLQYKLRSKGIKLSIERVREELLHAQISIVKDIKTLKRYVIPSKNTEELRKIYGAFNKKFNVTPYQLRS